MACGLRLRINSSSWPKLWSIRMKSTLTDSIMLARRLFANTSSFIEAPTGGERETSGSAAPTRFAPLKIRVANRSGRSRSPGSAAPPPRDVRQGPSTRYDRWPGWSIRPSIQPVLCLADLSAGACCVHTRSTISSCVLPASVGPYWIHARGDNLELSA